VGLVLTALAASVVAAGDAPPGLAAAFGNTVTATYPDGRVQRYWGRRGKASSGKWTADGEKVCLRQSKPIPAPNRYCTQFPDTVRVGASWKAKDMGGGPITLRIVKGGG
jgi:hypothetical protein